VIAGSGLSQVSDAVLMGRVQEDDVEAFAELYDRLAPRALGVARGVLGPRGDRASDAVQEAFLTLWRNRGAYRADRAEVHTWAFAIVRNRAIDSLRRHGRHDRRRADENAVPSALAAPDDVHADVVAADDGRRLRELLADLPETQREVIALAYYGQLTHTEIAACLTLPVGTVKGRMRLGLTKLRGRLAG
jgi:RNA polymerase sigma-70 factor (ECF subfamily)